MGIRLEQAGGVGHIRIEFHRRRNALRPDDALEIAEVVQRLAHDVPLLVLSGSAEAFCAGADLAVVAEMRGADLEEKLRSVYANYHLMTRALVEFPGISIAALDGPAIGLGADLALACTQRYVGSGGWIQEGWHGFGLIPGAGGLWCAIHHAGQAGAWQLLTQDRCDGPTLERFGLATAVDGDAESAALQVAAALGSYGADWIRAYSSLMGLARMEPFGTHLWRCLEYQSKLVEGAGFAAAVERARHVVASNGLDAAQEENG
jgi:enoyl-CoA hydratase/carnithine racemase